MVSGSVLALIFFIRLCGDTPHRQEISCPLCPEPSANSAVGSKIFQMVSMVDRVNEFLI